jgi:hypothetical protein
LLAKRRVKEHAIAASRCSVERHPGSSYRSKNISGSVGAAEGCESVMPDTLQSLPRVLVSSCKILEIITYWLRIFSTMAVVELFSTSPSTRTSPP